jgi:hypothetical protein
MAAYRLLVAEYVDDDLVNEYRVKLTQTSTGAPTVAAVLKNEVGTIVWGYTSAGVYTGTLAGAFANGIKTTGGVIDSDTEDEWSVVRTSADVITLTTSRAGTPTNGLMTACSIDIDVIV